MTQREWADKDFYAELGVSSGASADDIRKAYRTLARDLHPDANPGNSEAEERFKRVSEAHAVLSDPAKRKDYDELRAMMASGGFGRGGFGRGARSGAGDFGGGGGFRSTANPFGAAGAGSAAGAADFSDIFGGLFSQGPRRREARQAGADVATDITLDFRDAARGVTVPVTLTNPSPCTSCHGSGARPGTSPKVCATCNGSGYRSVQRGTFAMSEPCPDCHGQGTVIEDPCPDCSGTGVVTRSRTIQVRVPAGVDDGQRIRLAGRGEAGLRGAPSGDLYVTVHVRKDPLFRREGDDLHVTVPVSFPELVLGATVHVPTLDGSVGIKIPAGSAADRTLRVRGRGIHRRNGTPGDLLVSLHVAVPDTLSDDALAALRTYADAEKASGFDPRPGGLGA